MRIWCLKRFLTQRVDPAVRGGGIRFAPLGPAKYIYEPWKAPPAVQRAARCVVGVDYPAPLVDHAEARELNLRRMQAACPAPRWAAAGVCPGRMVVPSGKAVALNIGQGF